jgi:hypothetical protein
MKSIEYMLLTALTSAITVGLGTLLWPALSNLGAIFSQITHALQVKP